MLKKISLFVNTIKYLKLSQLYYQGMHKLLPGGSFLDQLNNKERCSELNLWIKELDEEEEYIERFNPDGLMNGHITLLNEERPFDRWSFDKATHLWNFNVQYLEYLVSLVGKAKLSGDSGYIVKMNEIVDNWMKTGCNSLDASHPYTISLRITNLLIILQYVDNKALLISYIYAQYQYLLKHQEKHLLGNHYLENLKAIILCSIAFDENDIYKKYINVFLKEVKRQILSDGFHFELSPMYHRIVLEDLIRVGYALQQINAMEYKYVVAYIHRMTDAMNTIEKGTKRVPLFNDSGESVSKSNVLLTMAAKRLFGIHSVDNVELAAAGYYKLYTQNITLVVDGGELGPSYMPGHSHCDCLSFELFYKGDPIFVNSGTYQYQGDYRDYFRSTEAHNTAMIDNHEQSELWGQHRAARRIRKIKAGVSDSSFVGSYVNCLGERHKRKIVLSDNTIDIFDCIFGNGSVRSFLHLAPGLHYSNGRITVGNKLTILVESREAAISIIKSPYSEKFGVLEEKETIVFSWRNDSKEHGYRIVFKEKSFEEDY